MEFLIIENYITNTNFFLLFAAMILYLLQSASFLTGKWVVLSNYSILGSGLLQALFLILRWFSSGHFPLSNLYESLLFLSWVLTSFLVFFNIQLKKSALNIKTNNQQLKKPNYSEQNFPFKLQTNINQDYLKNFSFESFLGTIITPLILLINTFATFSLPPELKMSTSLVPALQSNWLVMHVSLMMFSYGALLCGCLLAIAFLMVPFFTTGLFSKNPISLKQKNEEIFTENNPITTSYKNPELHSILLTPNQRNIKFAQTNNELSEILDNLSYRILGFGFPLLTIGILSGAVWANKSWGSYWSWDPKETWALITWLIFAIYLHTRISYGWSGRQSALIAALGFVIIWICYLGVNLLGNGLHSYGFFT